MNWKMANIGKTCSVAMLCMTMAAGCVGDDTLVAGQNVGVLSTFSTCPIVAIPSYTGDVTLFNPIDSRDASAIDVVAQMTNMRSTCNEGADKLYTEVNFEIAAQRRNANGARNVTVPYFSTVVRGGTAVLSKRIGSVTLQFADGAYRASAPAKAGAYVAMSEAALPEDIQQKITEVRRDGDASAAVDPLSLPEVQAAIKRASFEVLVGFQLTEAQLRYNATR